MILGVMSISSFTALHVIISLVAIVSGVIVVLGMLGSHRLAGLTALFLATTLLTSATGFLFPIKNFTPALAVGVLPLILLLIALIGLYSRRLRGSWRWMYVVTAITALWFNVFVLIVQAFLKVPTLHAFAPAGNEPPFLIAQGGVLAVFVVLGAVALVKFHPAPPLSA